MTLAMQALLILCSMPFGTQQKRDTLVFGGRTYVIREVPMLALWDHGVGSVGTGAQKRPAFEVRDSSNNSGYEAQFEIRSSKLYLRKIAGWINGKKRKNERIIPGKRFPIVAEWFTGKIHLEVGDFDQRAQEATAVIVFLIEAGVVEKVEFFERMKPVMSWNGLPYTERAAVQKTDK